MPCSFASWVFCIRRHLVVFSVGECGRWCRAKYPDHESVRTCVHIPVPPPAMTKANDLKPLSLPSPIFEWDRFFFIIHFISPYHVQLSPLALEIRDESNSMS